MIVSFRDREAERIWSGEGSRRLPPWIQAAALRRLRQLNQAASLAELRVCFRWTDRGPQDVEIVDYHA